MVYYKYACLNNRYIDICRANMSNTVGIEGLLVGPYRWAASTYSSFIVKAYNIIKKEMERLANKETNLKEWMYPGNRNKRARRENQNLASNSQDNGGEIGEFVAKITAESSTVLGDKDWVDSIGPNYWNIFKFDKDGKDRYKLDDINGAFVEPKRKSVVQLFKLIRHKIEHVQTYEDRTKEKLTEFFDKDDKGEYHFKERNFISFWISKFPKLIPFLWLRFYKYREKLENYYPGYEMDIKGFEDFLLDLNMLEKKLQIVLFSDLENGIFFWIF